MFAKEFTHKNGLYTAMHNVKYFCINKKCVLTRMMFDKQNPKN